MSADSRDDRLTDLLAGDRPRIIAPAPRLGDGGERWRADLERIEQLGFDIVAVSEHYTGGWSMEPLAALAFAAALSRRLWVLPLVLNNDMRHPAVLAKAILTTDVLSEGRVLLGLGAGWLRADYDALGLPFDSASVRISRLEEALTIVKTCFARPSVEHNGHYYTIRELEALPRPVRDSGPPVLVGGGGPRVLRLAGQTADIVGVHVALGAGGFDEGAARELLLPQIRRKVDIVHRAASELDRPRPTIQFTPAVVVVDGEQSTANRPGFTDYIALHAHEFADSPAVLVGDAKNIADKMRRWQEELGIGIWHLGTNLGAISRVIDRIHG